MDAESRAEQRRMIIAGDRIEVRRRFGDRRLLRLVGPGKPPVKSERMAGRGEQETALQHRRHVIHAQSDALR